MVYLSETNNEEGDNSNELFEPRFPRYKTYPKEI